MSMTKAHIKTSRKYNEKTYDRINIYVTTGKRDEIKIFAEKNGESLNGFINRTIYEAMNKKNNGDYTFLFFIFILTPKLTPNNSKY